MHEQHVNINNKNIIFVKELENKAYEIATYSITTIHEIKGNEKVTKSDFIPKYYDAIYTQTKPRQQKNEGFVFRYLREERDCSWNSFRNEPQDRPLGLSPI
jgi:hypothetical protein